MTGTHSRRTECEATTSVRLRPDRARERGEDGSKPATNAAFVDLDRTGPEVGR